MSEKKRRMLHALLVGVMALTALLGCGIMDWGDMDRSDWGWDGSKGDAPDVPDGTPTPTPINPELQ